MKPEQKGVFSKPTIHYQDRDIVIANKPAHWLVHPWREKARDKPDLMNFLKDQLDLYLYPVHRLDAPVSGLVVFALNKKTAHYLKENWHEKVNQKEYLLLCRGKIESQGQFDFPLKDGKKKPVWKKSLTHFNPIQYYPKDDCSLVRVKIETGRRHQIRRHFSRTNFNLIGD